MMSDVSSVNAVVVLVMRRGIEPCWQADVCIGLCWQDDVCIESRWQANVCIEPCLEAPIFGFMTHDGEWSLQVLYEVIHNHLIQHSKCRKYTLCSRPDLNVGVVLYAIDQLVYSILFFCPQTKFPLLVIFSYLEYKLGTQHLYQ